MPSHYTGILSMDYISGNTLTSRNCKYFQEFTLIVWEYILIVGNIRGELLKYLGIQLIYSCGQPKPTNKIGIFL